MRESVLLIMFDLPTETPQMRRQGARFRNGLKKLGYQMLQKSIYYKKIGNVTFITAEQKKTVPFLPEEGTIHFLPIPLGTFTQITALIGPDFDTERLTATVLEFD